MVDVLKAEEESAILLPGGGVSDDGRVSVAEVELAGGAGREAGDHF